MTKNSLYTLLVLAIQHSASIAVELNGQEFFTNPPSNISINSAYKNAYQRSYPVISFELPRDAGANLKQISLLQISGTQTWDWRTSKTSVYEGPYNLRKKGKTGLAKIKIDDKQKSIRIIFTPSIKPGQTASVVIPSNNPRQGIYEWSSSFYPDSKLSIPSKSLGPVLRLSIYKLNNDY